MYIQFGFISKLFRSLSLSCCSVTQLCLALCNPMACSLPGISVIHHLLNWLKFMSIESITPSNHLIHCHPALFLPSVFPSISIFSNESVLCIRWPKYWSFNFSISPSNKHSRLISFRMDWISLQSKRHSRVFSNTHLKASVFQCSAFSLWSNSHLLM